MPTRKRLILHVGLHKTGTTAIQRFLHLNMRNLMDQGILYLAPFTPGHDRIFHPQGSYSFVRMARALATSSSPYPTMLISSEEVLDTLLGEDADALRDLLNEAFETRIIVYLRRQDHLKERVYAEIVKDWYVGPIERDTHYDLDLWGRLEGLAALVGREALSVGLYDDVSDGTAPLLRDFCARAGIDLTGFARPKGRPNASLSRRATLFLSSVMLPGGPVSKRFFEFLRQDDTLRDDGVPFLSPPSYRRRILEAHADGNARIAETYLGRPMPSFTLDGDWYPAAPITRPAVVRLRERYLDWCRADDASQKALKKGAVPITAEVFDRVRTPPSLDTPGRS